MNAYMIEIDNEDYLIDLHNAKSVSDNIIDATQQRVKLDTYLVNTIAYILYRDRRGGELADLWASDEFLKSLDWQLER